MTDRDPPPPVAAPAERSGADGGPPAARDGRPGGPRSGPAIAGPFDRAGYRAWEAAGDRARVLFVGRGPEASRQRVVAAVAPASGPGGPSAGTAEAKQVHSARVLTASGPGRCGEGDALVTGVPRLATTVVTADCVPLLVEAGERVAAVHAGWRGVVAGVVGATVDRLLAEGAPPTGRWTAWIGPAIGPCCYEVGEDVAERVAAASGPEAVVVRPGGRPHVDLAAAVRRQLASRGAVDVRTLALCTRCEEESLWSYRRSGARAGRNLAAIWRR